MLFRYRSSITQQQVFIDATAKSRISTAVDKYHQHCFVRAIDNACEFGEDLAQERKPQGVSVLLSCNWLDSNLDTALFYSCTVQIYICRIAFKMLQPMRCYTGRDTEEGSSRAQESTALSTRAFWWQVLLELWLGGKQAHIFALPLAGRHRLLSTRFKNPTRFHLLCWAHCFQLQLEDSVRQQRLRWAGALGSLA